MNGYYISTVVHYWREFMGLMLLNRHYRQIAKSNHVSHSSISLFLFLIRTLKFCISLWLSLSQEHLSAKRTKIEIPNRISRMISSTTPLRRNYACYSVGLARLNDPQCPSLPLPLRPTRLVPCSSIWPLHQRPAPPCTPWMYAYMLIDA